MWVGCSADAKFESLLEQIAKQYEKVTKTEGVKIAELSLRGALLDREEPVGFWVKDQELLYATFEKKIEEPKRQAPTHDPSAPPAVANQPANQGQKTNKKELNVSTEGNGVVVTHEMPTHTKYPLTELSPQAMSLCVMGSDKVGKTSFISFFIGGDKGQENNGVKTWEKKIEVDSVVHKVLLVDTEYETIEKTENGYFSGGQAFLFIFDVTNRASFDALKDKLLGLCVASRGHEPSVPVTIIANKCDAQNERVVSSQETIALAKELSTLIKGSVGLYEASAKTGQNVVLAVQDTFLNVLMWRSCDDNNQDGGYCNLM